MSKSEIKQLTQEMIDDFADYYVRNGGNWGNLKNALDSGSLEDPHLLLLKGLSPLVQPAGNEAPGPEHDAHGARLLDYLLRMPMELRERLSMLYIPVRVQVRDDLRIEIALRLKVPMSGNVFIDQMIREARAIERQDAVNKAADVARAQMQVMQQAKLGGGTPSSGPKIETPNFRITDE